MKSLPLACLVALVAILAAGCPSGPGTTPLTINPLSVQLNVGESTTFTASSGDSTDFFSWRTSDARVATVTPRGAVTAVAPGSALITATSGRSGRSVSATVTVLEGDQTIALVAVSPSAATIAVGGSVRLAPATTRENGEFLWFSNNELIATVDSSGRVSGVGPGTAEITVRGDSPAERATAMITVVEPTVHVASVHPLGARILVGEQVALSAISTDPLDSFVWSSDLDSTAVVDENGVVTGVGSGGVLIHARGSNSGVTGSAVITVQRPAEHRVTVSPTTVTIGVGDSLAFSGSTTRPGDTLTWSSEDPAIATVSSSGVVTGTGIGTVSIAAEGAEPDERGVALVRVVEGRVRIAAVRPLQATIPAGESITLTASSRDAAEAFTWSSSNVALAQVDGSGVVRGVAPGEVRITATGQTTGAVGQSIVEVTAAVTHQLSVFPSAASIEAGEQLALSAASTRSGDRILWSTDAPEVAQVDGDGVVTAEGVGTARITASGLDSGLTASTVITVVEPADHVVEVLPQAATITLGESFALTATSSYEFDDLFLWWSDDEAIVDVDINGVITGLEEGTVEIYATGINSLVTGSATITVTAPVPLARPLYVLPEGASLLIGEQVSLEATGLRTGDTVTWSSSNGGVATVSASGRVTAVGLGEATITVRRAKPPAEGTALIRVVEPPAEEALIQPMEVSLFVGESVDLSAESSDPAEEFVWSSDDETVSVVEPSTGVATGVGPGQARVTAVGQRTGATSASSLTVIEPVVHQVSVSPSAVMIGTGEAIQLAATSTRTGDTFTWSSSDPAVAAVSTSGRVSGLGAGAATITATGAAAGETGTAEVTVVAPVAHSVTIEPISASIMAGGAIALGAISTDPSDSFTWSSSDNALATVDASGVVTGVAVGIVEIRARGTNSGAVGVADVTITEQLVHRVSVDPQSATLEVAQTLPLAAMSTEPADTFTWRSSNTAVATVSATGLVTAVGAGSASITATGSNSGAEDSASITVSLDNTPPTIALGPPSASVTAAGPVQFRVIYDGADTITLAPANVQLSLTGTATASVLSVTETGAGERTISVGAIAGDGAFTISIPPGTASDGAGNLAPGAGPSAQVVVDNTAPAVTIAPPSVAVTRDGPVSFKVTYGGASAITLTKAQVLVNGTGSASAILADVTATGENERTVTFSSVGGDGTLGISIAAGTATDAAGNRAPAAGPSATFTVDNTPPGVALSGPSAALTNTGPVEYRVTYTGADTISLARADVLLNGTGTASATISPVATTAEGERTVTLTNLAGDGTLGISLVAATASDAAGNKALEAGPSATFEVDNTPPSIVIGEPSVLITSAGPVTFPVTFDGADHITLEPKDIIVNTTGSAAAAVESIAVTGFATRAVTLASIIGNGTLGISIAAGAATDAAGNPAPAAGPSATAQVDNAAPTISISEPSAAATFDGPVSYTLTYADAAAITLAPADITLESADGVTASIAVTGAGTTQRTVTLTNITGAGEARIRIAANTATSASAAPAGPAGPSAPFRAHPVLEPGTGFTAPTPQPAPIGNPEDFGFDAKAIARWDVVPYQTFDAYFEIGVVAFHINGIDRVEFSVNNGPWTAVREMTLNPRTDVVEYWVGLDARDFADGPIEVRAVVYPTVGIPRVLEGPQTSEKTSRGEFSLFLNTNAGRTLPEIARYVATTGSDSNDGSAEAPFRTIMRAARAIQNASPAGNADGGTVYLLPGEYRIGTYSFSLLTTTVNRWLTIEPAPGVAREEVRLNGADTDGLRTRLVRLRSVTLAPDSATNQNMIRSNGPLEDYYWVDNCVLIGPGRTVNAAWSVGLSGIFNTDTQVSDCRDALSGNLVRNIQISNIGSDALSGSGLAVNSTVEGIDTSGTSFHADALQYFANFIIENRLAYGITVRTGDGQGFFAGDNIALRDIAFVNCDVDNQVAPNVQNVFQFGGPTEHLYVLNCRFRGVARWRTDFNFAAHNVVVENTVFSSLPSPFEVSGVTYIDVSRN